MSRAHAVGLADTASAFTGAGDFGRRAAKLARLVETLGPPPAACRSGGHDRPVGDWVEGVAVLLGAIGVSELVVAGWLRQRRRLRDYVHDDPGELAGSAEADEGAAAFGLLVERALAELPPALAARMSNVTVAIEDEPPVGMPLLGLYHGVPLTRRGAGYAGVAPDTITIFRGPLERLTGGEPERLAAQVRRTVLHEVAHHFGISDARLVELDRY